MQLTQKEERMFSGEFGKGVQQALEYQIKVGEFFGAKKLIPINNAHMMGDMEVLGQVGFDFFKDLAALDTICAVKTTTNARSFDFNYVNKFNQDKDISKKEKVLISTLEKMNISTVDSCINYQSYYQPKKHEHVAWGDTGTVIYVNSVLGARSNFESGPAALAAGITGRVPAYGFHLDENRCGKILVKIEADLKDLADWGAIGKIVGEKHQNYSMVPVFDGLKKDPTDDEIKHLGASLASYGSMAMFHIVGVTPEAGTLKEAFQGTEPENEITITNADIESVYSNYDTENADPNLVVFSGPQQSLSELETLSNLLKNQKIKDGTFLIVTTDSHMKKAAEELGYIQIIEEAGGLIMEGVCFYILHGLSDIRIENKWKDLVTNSAKLANVIGAHKFNTILRRTEECIESAVTGRLK